MISSAAARFSGLKTSSNRRLTRALLSSDIFSSLLIHTAAVPPRAHPFADASSATTTSRGEGGRRVRWSEPEAESDDDARYVARQPPAISSVDLSRVTFSARDVPRRAGGFRGARASRQD